MAARIAAGPCTARACEASHGSRSFESSADCTQRSAGFTPHQRQHFLPDAIGLLQVRRAGQDESIRTQLYELVELLCNLLIVADDAVGLAAAQQRESGPDIRLDDQVPVTVESPGAQAALACCAH